MKNEIELKGIKLFNGTCTTLSMSSHYGIPLVICPKGGSPSGIYLSTFQKEDISDQLRDLIEGHEGKICYDMKEVINALHAIEIIIAGPVFDIKLADQILRAGLDDNKRTMNDLTMTYLGEYVEDDDFYLEHYLELKDVMTSKLIANKLKEKFIQESIKLIIIYSQ